MKKCLLVILVAILTLELNAQIREARVPAFRGMIERVQPNGDTLRTFLRGDERQHWLMTEDGWQIKENKRGWLVYLKQKKNGETKATCRKAHNAEDRKKCEKRWLEKHGAKKVIR